MTVIFFYKISFVIGNIVNFHTDGFANISRDAFKKGRISIHLTRWTRFWTASFYACLLLARFRYCFVHKNIVACFFGTRRYAGTILSATLIALDCCKKSVDPESTIDEYYLRHSSCDRHLIGTPRLLHSCA